MTTAIEHLLSVVEKNEGALAVSFTKDTWSVACEFGREAEDSPMVGGAAYGMSDVSWAEATEQAASQCGWGPVQAPEALVNDDRPRVDGTKCPWRGVSLGIGVEPNTEMGCALDTGHEGEHDPVPLEVTA